MSEPSEDVVRSGDDFHLPKSKRSRVMRLLVGLTVLAVALLALYSWHLPSAQEQLAALDKARAVPDQENAALVYARLLSDYKDPITFADLTKAVSDTDANAIRKDPSLDRHTLKNRGYMSHPWATSEFPEVAKSVDMFSRHVGTFLEAARLERCRFPFCRPPDTVEKWTYGDLTVDTMANCSNLLTASAYLDLGECRIDAAQSKAIALMRMSSHLYQHYFLRESMLAESKGLRILSTLLLTANSGLLDLNTLQAFVGPLDDQLASFECEGDRVYQLQWKNYLDHAIEMPVISDPRSHIWYCIRKGRWSQMFKFQHYDGIDVQASRRSRYAHLLAERGRYRLFIEFRRFKDETGQWPNRLDQVSPRLSADVPAALTESQPLTLSLADHCFVLYVPPSGDPNATERNLLIQDGRALSPGERQFLDSHLQDCFRTLTTTYRRESSFRWEEDIEDWFLDMARYSVPILLTHLMQGDDDTKIAALNLLAKMADESYRSDSRHTFFLQDLIDGYHRETTPRGKEHHLGILGFFRNVSKEDQAKVVGLLREVMIHGDTAELRTAAAMALLRASRTEGLYELLNAGITQDGHQFGPEGRWYVLQSIWSILFSDGYDPWRWGHGHGPDGYQFREMGDGRDDGFLKSVPEQKYVDRYVERIDGWWKENRNRLKAVLEGDPNTSQLMKQMFFYESYAQ